MENKEIDHDAVDRLMARRLKDLRADRGWSLDELARRSGVSRATLSRLENHEVSATTAVLSKLCFAYGLNMSRLMRMVEDQFQPMLRPAEQPLWIDPDKGFRRRSISPPAQSLVGEVLQCELPPNTCIDYDDSPRPGLEHHLVLLEGRLDMTVGGERHALQPGDCLRYQLFGPSSFVTGAEGARYFLFLA